MKLRCPIWAAGQVALGLMAALAISALAGQDAGQESPQAGTQQSQERPTLGSRNGPGVNSGPLTSTTTDLRKLLRIRTLYVENIDNSLSDKLVETLGKLGRFHLVSKEKDADAIVRGSCLESRRLKRVHSEVYISDPNGASVWQDTIYRPFNPPALEQAVSDTATIVADHLERTVREALQR